MFLESIAERIRAHRSGLSGLVRLDMQPEFVNINGRINEEDLFINNELFSAHGFRKLHLEIGEFGKGLQILHCVFFPDPRFDVPIFGADVVKTTNGVSAAIVDLSPVGPQLQEDFEKQLINLVVPSFTYVRELPSWGNIFSNYVKFVRPINLNEENIFIDLVDQYLEILVSNIPSIEPDPLKSKKTIERYNAQKFYCLQQKQNDKTRSVLAKAFNPMWADQYIDKLLFDYPEKL